MRRFLGPKTLIFVLFLALTAALAAACADREPSAQSQGRTNRQPVDQAAALAQEEPGPPPAPARIPVPSQEDPSVATPPVTPLRTVSPEYPEAARASGLTGTVLIEVVVGEDGTVHEAVVKEARGDASLVEAALAAARQWTFEPLAAGTAPVTVAIPFEFKLEGAGSETGKK